MRKILFLLVSAFMTLQSAAQFTAIPDTAFEGSLVVQGIDSDGVINGQVLTADISGLTILDVSASNISSLTGIEDFAALEDLNCANNPLLGTMDISQNANLIVLNCANSNMTDLDVSNNLFLEELYVSFNSLTSLDLSFNAGLRFLQCDNNQITGLNVTNSTLLEELLCGNNALQGFLDLSQNSLLTTFIASGNSSLFCVQVANAADANAGAGIYATWTIDGFAVYSEDCLDVVTYVPDDAFEQYLMDQGFDTQLDNYVLTANIEMETTVDVTSLGVADLTGIEDFAALQELYCSGNVLTSLDVSQNTNLLVLECSNNLLTNLGLNMALTSLICDNNQLTDIDVLQNPNLNTLFCNNNQLGQILFLQGLNLLTAFNSANNPALVCIQVDNPADAASGAGQYATWNKDVIAFYSDDCVLSSEYFSLEASGTVYPNPAHSEIRIELPSYTIEKVRIYDMQGQELLESNAARVNIEKLAEGIYIVIVKTTDNKRFYKKIVVSAARKD